MFLITEGLLLIKNLAPKSHSGLISLFGEHFVKTDIFSKEMGRHLNRAHDKRLIGDYASSIIIKKNEAQGLLDIGQDFVEKIAEYLDINTKYIENIYSIIRDCLIFIRNGLHLLK